MPVCQCCGSKLRTEALSNIWGDDALLDCCNRAYLEAEATGAGTVELVHFLRIAAQMPEAHPTLERFGIKQHSLIQGHAEHGTRAGRDPGAPIQTGSELTNLINHAKTRAATQNREFISLQEVLTIFLSAPTKFTSLHYATHIADHINQHRQLERTHLYGVATSARREASTHIAHADTSHSHVNPAPQHHDRLASLRTTRGQTVRASATVGTTLPYEFAAHNRSTTANHDHNFTKLNERLNAQEQLLLTIAEELRATRQNQARTTEANAKAANNTRSGSHSTQTNQQSSHQTASRARNTTPTHDITRDSDQRRQTEYSNNSRSTQSNGNTNRQTISAVTTTSESQSAGNNSNRSSSSGSRNAKSSRSNSTHLSRRERRRQRRQQRRNYMRQKTRHSRSNHSSSKSFRIQNDDTRTPLTSTRNVYEPRAKTEHDTNTEDDAATGEKRFYLAIDDDIVCAPSIGPKTADRLEKQGIFSVRDLFDCDTNRLATELDVRHISAERLTHWQQQAKLVCTIPWLRGTHAQLLVGAGFDSLEKILSSDRDDICAGILRFALTRDGQSILRSGPPPQVEKIVQWIEHAQLAEPQRAA